MAALWAVSNSTGGTSPRLSCSRWWLNQPMYSHDASSSCDRVRHTRSAISSVLNCRRSFGHRVVQRVSDRADRLSSRYLQLLRVVDDGVLAPGIRCAPAGSQRRAPWSRSPSAARRAPGWCACWRPAASRPPSAENTSRMKRRTTPSQHRRYVKSPTHNRSGACAVNSRPPGPSAWPRPGRAWWSAMASRAASRPGSRWWPSAAAPGTATAGLAGAFERLAHPPIPIRPIVGLVHLPIRPGSRSSSTARAERCPRLAGSRQTPTRPRSGRSARPRNERAAHRCTAHYGRSGSSSCAKYTDAACRISFARRSSKFSRRSRRNSSRSFALDSPSRLPSSICARRTCFRNVSGPHPQILGDMSDRPLALKRDPDTALEQLIKVFGRDID